MKKPLKLLHFVPFLRRPSGAVSTPTALMRQAQRDGTLCAIHLRDAPHPWPSNAHLRDHKTKT
jgi:hypothetical protein